MSLETTYQHWKPCKDNDEVLWLCFDKANSQVNTLNEEVFAELETILDEVISDKANIKGVIFCSNKKTGFIAGADIEKFTQFKTEEEAKTFIERGQAICNKIETLPVPTVAMIEGFCLGGGLELSLACDYRVAVDDNKKNIGLPEVMLGIQPGWGGSVRLPELIGGPAALGMIMTGRSVHAKAANRMGFIDAAVPKRQLKRAAKHYVMKKPAKHKASKLQALTNSKIIRPIIAAKARRDAMKKANPEHYPAPFAVLENWLEHGVDRKKALKAEVDSITKLALGDTARNLVRIFFLQERMKALAKATDFKAQHVHVIGAGVMGGDIAAWCALRGLNVTLQDNNEKAIAGTIARAHKLFEKKLKKPLLVTAAMDRLQADTQGHGAKHADVIIEAIFENLKVKQELLSSLEKIMRKDAILATNTSSIPLDEINAALKQPERLVGIHFFNPVAKMQLVEVVHGKVTDQKVIDDATAFVKQISRLPVPVTSSPGFLVNRSLMPYLMECMQLLEEGVPAEEIDKAAESFGMPMGPVELADTVGLDICLSVATNLTEKFGGEVPDKLRAMVEKGTLGKKTGKGFYSYKKGKPVKATPKDFKKDSDIVDRLVLRMVNETVTCLREGVVPDADLCDAAMIFGTGFAPFRGGPVNYAKERGIAKVQQRLQDFTEKYGERFKPDAGLDSLKSQAAKTQFNSTEAA